MRDQERANPEDLNYYKQLAEQKVKECSTLAEEIICLRTDLDRSHSAFLHLQRETSLMGKQQIEKTLTSTQLTSSAQLTSSRTYFDCSSRREKNSFTPKGEKDLHSSQGNTLKRK